MTYVRKIPRRCLWAVSSLALLSTSLGPIWAQLPGSQLEQEVMRLLDKEPRGTSGDLTTSAAVLFWYSDLDRAFDASLERVKTARRAADRYLDRSPRTPAEWGHYISSLHEMQVAREVYQEKLRSVIAERRPVLQNALGDGIIASTTQSIDDTSSKQTAELAALIEVQNQILSQRSTIQAGRSPVINWPQGTDPIWKEELEAAIEAAVADGSLESDAWKRLRKRLGRLQRNLHSAAEELRTAAEAHWDQLDVLERQALAELNVLVEAQIDLASNAMLQQTTIRRVFMAQKTYDVWTQLNQ